MASRIESTRRSSRHPVGVTLVAFAIAAALVAWLVVAGLPAQPSLLIDLGQTRSSTGMPSRADVPGVRYVT